MDLIKSNYEATTRMTLFNYLKTGNPAYDAILSSIVISVFSFVINYIYFNISLSKYNIFYWYSI